MAYLRPMLLHEEYYAPVERNIQELFDLLIYRPLLAVMRRHYPELQNSLGALCSALRRGLVWYEDGKFSGKFNVALTKELRALGAEYNRGVWALPGGAVPAQVKIAIADAQSRAQALQRDILTVLDDMDVTRIDHSSKTAEEYISALGAMEGDFQKTISAAKLIGIVPKLTTGQKRIIAEEWGKNLDLYIKDWASENILKLRQQIQSPVLHGARAESFEKMIRESYGVSQRKAKFLARQETSLLMSKFQETRYLGAGLPRYRWSGANDERERKDHKALNNKIFSWDDPPVTNRKTRARNHPGGDFGCRCVAVPII